MNKVFLTGYLVYEPVLRTSKSGWACTSNRVSAGSLLADGKVVYDHIPIIAFGKTAEHIVAEFRKGDKVTIEARLRFAVDSRKANGICVSIDRISKVQKEIKDDVSRENEEVLALQEEEREWNNRGQAEED